MSSKSLELKKDIRAAILAAPDVVLDDADIMRALVGANERAMGGNIVDMRGVAMDRLEDRLGRLEQTHRSVIAAAYENLSGMQLIHRAVLRLLEADTFDAFLADLDGEVAGIMRVATIRLVVEPGETAAPRVRPDVLRPVPPGYIDAYLAPATWVEKPVVLRQTDGPPADLYGPDAEAIRSEACLHVDTGDGSAAAILLLGSGDAQQFAPQQATDLLEFFAQVVGRLLPRWLT